MPDTYETAYGDLTFQESHPSVLAALATVAGLHPPPVETCRVLELGCGTGFNLLAMSQSLPAGRFTGIDLSPTHIRRAIDTTAAIGAANVEFHCLSIDDFVIEPNRFDYIVAHGVYSWVPSKTREAILNIVQGSLAPQGVAYVSYNTLPGWHLRNLVRGSLQLYGRDGTTQLAGRFINPDSPFTHAFRAEWDGVRDLPDYYVNNEYFAAENEPLFFRDFVDRAGTHKLQFAAEACFFANAFAQPDTVQESLESAGPDPIHREQYLDWLTGRCFRQSLICHADVPLTHAPDPESILSLHMVRNPSATATDEMYGEVLRQLPAGPVPAAHIDLNGMPPAFTAAVLWSGWRDGLWSAYAGTPSMAADVSERPTACPLARLQAANGPECTNRLHRRVRLTPVEQTLIQTLDGTHNPQDREALQRLAALGLLAG